MLVNDYVIEVFVRHNINDEDEIYERIVGELTCSNKTLVGEDKNEANVDQVFSIGKHFDLKLGMHFTHQCKPPWQASILGLERKKT